VLAPLRTSSLVGGRGAAVLGGGAPERTRDVDGGGSSGGGGARAVLSESGARLLGGVSGKGVDCCSKLVGDVAGEERAM
jgi:hypothetical protein